MTEKPAELRVINWADANAPDFENWKAFPPDTVRKIVLGPSPGSSNEVPLKLDLHELLRRLPTFKNLTHLYLWQIDGLTQLPQAPPNLKCLDVRGCKNLTAIPPMPDPLVTLDLGGCDRIEVLPDGSFRELRYVYLDGCSLLKKFAPLVAILDRIKDLRIVGCRFDDLRADLCLEGNRAVAVRRHFAEQAPERQGSVALNTVKVLLVGNGRVGKTTLARRLRNEGPDPRQPSTHAIQFDSCSLPTFRPFEATHDEPLRLNVWDFGGQDLYHNTHRIFFQGASLFVVVWSVSEPEIPKAERDQNPHRPLSYWLDQVLSVNPDARIILVRTRADVDPRSHSWRDYAEPRHRDLRSIVEVAAFNGWGTAGEAGFEGQLAQVREAIASVAAAELGGAAKRAMAAGRARVADTLVALQRSNTQRGQSGLPLTDTVWSLERFRELVREQCRNHDGTEAEDARDPGPLIEWLHAAGYLFHDPKRFGDRLIVDQRWAVAGIYTVLQRGTFGAGELLSARGTFLPRELSEWGWGETGYSPAEQALLLSFMESCGTAVKIIDAADSQWGSDVFVCLSFLPKRPDLQRLGSPDWTLTPVGNDRLGSDAMAGLLVRIARHTGNQCQLWQWGANLPDRASGGTVRVEWKPFVPEGYGGRLGVEFHGGMAAESPVLEWLLQEIREVLKVVGLGLGTGLPEFETAPARFTAGVPRRAWKEGAPDQPFPGELPRRAPLSRVAFSLAGASAKPEENPRGWDLEAAPTALREALRPHESTGFSVDFYKDESSDRVSSVREFLKRLVHGDLVILFLSQRYLRSSYCMEELYQLARRLAGGGEDVAAWRAADWPPAKVLVFVLPDAVRGHRTDRWRDDWRNHWGRVSSAHVNQLADEFYRSDLEKTLEELKREQRPEFGPCHAWLWSMNKPTRRDEVADWLKDFSHGKEAPDLPTLGAAEQLAEWAGETAAIVVDQVRQGQGCLKRDERITRLVGLIEEAIAHSKAAEAKEFLAQLLADSPVHADQWQRKDWSRWSANLQRAGELLHEQNS